MKDVIKIAAGILLALGVLCGGCGGLLGVGNVLHRVLPEQPRE